VAIDAAALGERLLGGQEPEFLELLDTLGEAVTIRDSGDTLVYANRAAIRYLGFDSLDELKQASLSRIMAQYQVTDETGEPLSMADIPSVRLLEGKDAEPLLLRTVHRETGQSRWQLLKAAALSSATGTPTLTVMIIEDVTAVKTAEVHMRMLSECSRILASSLDLRQTLRNVARATVPGLADWCVIDLLDDEGCRELIATAHREPSKDGFVVELRGADPLPPASASSVGRVLRTRRAELFPDISLADVRRVAPDPQMLQQLEDLKLRSVMVVPIHIRERSIGVLTFGTGKSARRLGEEELTLAVQIAARAAVAVENSRLHTRLTRISETLSQSLLPAPLPEIPGWEIAGLYRPAGTSQRIEVGGDFYEVFRTDDAALAVIGDVTGHGVAAATATALLRHGARFASRLEPEPAGVLRRLDEELRQRAENTMCSALCARLGQREVVLGSAGHPPALLCDARGQVSEVSTAGPLLGAFDDGRWGQERVAVQEGELVLLYTDGVTETPGLNERFGLQRLKELLARTAGQAPETVLAALDQSLESFRSGEATDDVAALALRAVSVGDL
jgi:PAS domain S-box-containing protein